MALVLLALRQQMRMSEAIGGQDESTELHVRCTRPAGKPHQCSQVVPIHHRRRAEAVGKRIHAAATIHARSIPSRPRPRNPVRRDQAHRRRHRPRELECRPQSSREAALERAPTSTTSASRRLHALSAVSRRSKLRSMHLRADVLPDVAVIARHRPPALSDRSEVGPRRSAGMKQGIRRQQVQVGRGGALLAVRMRPAGQYLPLRGSARTRVNSCGVPGATGIPREARNHVGLSRSCSGASTSLRAATQPMKIW